MKNIKRRNTNERIAKEMAKYIEELKHLYEINPELARERSKESLIASGVLDKDGTPKENIVDNPHTGIEKTTRKPKIMIKKSLI